MLIPIDEGKILGKTQYLLMIKNSSPTRIRGELPHPYKGKL